MPDYVWVKDIDGFEYAVVRSALNPEIHKEVEGAHVVLDANSLPTLAIEASEEPAKSVKTEQVKHATTPVVTKADLIANHGKEN